MGCAQFKSMTLEEKVLLHRYLSIVIYLSIAHGWRGNADRHPQEDSA